MTKCGDTDAALNQGGSEYYDSAKPTFFGDEMLCGSAFELIEAVTAGTRVLIAAVDTDFRYTYFNREHRDELRRITGKDAAIGMSLMEVLADMPDERDKAIAIWRRALEGEVIVQELMFGDPGRHRRWYCTHHTPIRNTAGKIIGAGEVTSDITDVKNAEAALRRSEERWGLAQDAVNVGIWDWDLASGEVKCTPQLGCIFGRDPDEIPGSYAAFRGCIDPDDLPEFERQCEAAVAERKPFDIDYRVWLTSGDLRWVNCKGAASYDADGQPQRISAINIDITRRKEAERQLLLQAEILARVTDGVNIVSAATGKIIYNNSAFEAMFGYASGELLGRSPAILNSFALASPEASEAQIVEALRATGCWQGDLMNRRKDGSSFWTNATITTHDLPHWGSIWLGIQSDITERKQRETELERQRSLLNGIMSATDVMLALLDTSFNFVWVNPAYADTCRMRSEEMVGKNHFTLYPSDENEAIFRQVRDSGTEVFYKDKPFVFADQPERGTTYWDWSLVPSLDAEGKVIGLVFSLRETTRYKRLELALAASEDRYRRLAEQSPDGIFVADADGYYEDVNQAGAEMLGYTREEVLRRCINDIILPDEAARLPGELERFAGGAIARSEWTFVRKDGTRFCGEVHGVQLPDGRLQGVLRDITARKQAEAENLAAFARQRDALVAEVHHRIKNHLHGVAGLLDVQIDDHPDAAQPLRDAIAQVKAIAAVYGLQGVAAGSDLELHRIAAVLAETAVGPVPVEFSRSGDFAFALTERDAVPIALIINELISNSLKHLLPTHSQQRIRVRLESSRGGATVVIRGGSARLPVGFDFYRQLGTGTGLELVATLLPPEGTRLDFRQLGDEVSAELHLAPPVIIAL